MPPGCRKRGVGGGGLVVRAAAADNGFRGGLWVMATSSTTAVAEDLVWVGPMAMAVGEKRWRGSEVPPSMGSGGGSTAGSGSARDGVESHRGRGGGRTEREETKRQGGRPIILSERVPSVDASLRIIYLRKPCTYHFHRVKCKHFCKDFVGFTIRKEVLFYTKEEKEINLLNDLFPERKTKILLI